MKKIGKQQIFNIAITLIFFICEIVGLILVDMADPAVGFDREEVVRIVFTALGYSCLFLVLYLGGSKLWKRWFTLENDIFLRKILKKQWMLVLIILVAWLPCFLAYYPAIYSYDGEPQLIQYTSSMFDNHHPVFHTLIMGWCYDFGRFVSERIPLYFDGMALYSVIQMLALAYSFSEVIVTERKMRIGYRIQLITLLYFAIYPVHPLMAISTTKDTLFTACFIVMLVCLWQVIGFEKQPVKETIVIYIKLILSLLLSMLIRRNGVYIVYGLLITIGGILLFSIFKNRKKETLRLTWDDRNNLVVGLALSIVLMLFSLISFDVSDYVLMTATSAIQGESAEALSIPLQQIARAYKSNSINMTDEEKEEIFRFLPDEGIQNYRPYISDGVKQRFNNEEFQKDPKGFIKMWMGVLKKYPESCVLATMYNTMGLWFPSDESHTQVYKDWWRDRTGYMITDANPVFVAMNYVREENLLPLVRDWYEDFATECRYRKLGILSPLFIFIFSPAIFCLITVFALFRIIYIGKNRRLLIVLLPLLINLMTIFAGPCVLVRYIYPLMCAVPIEFCLLRETYKD